MLKIYICPSCHNIRMVSKKPNAICLHCNEVLKECAISYDEYTKLSEEQRDIYKKKWKNR